MSERQHPNLTVEQAMWVRDIAYDAYQEAMDLVNPTGVRVISGSGVTACKIVTEKMRSYIEDKAMEGIRPSTPETAPNAEA